MRRIMGRKSGIAVILLALCLQAAAVRAGENTEGEVKDMITENVSVSDPAEARKAVWETYRASALEDPVLQEEFAENALHYGDVTMKFFCRTVGEEPEGGYPLYIALHGGGQSDTPYLNESQWIDMQKYYKRSLKCGIYVAVRGVRDTWDTHFNPESYPLYDRLIRYFILEKNINPNRVYLEGFSAGGDGVYAISPRMADRFAAVNMSAGHPNGVGFLNMRNLPIQLQVGEMDEAYGRNYATAEYDALLNDLSGQYGGFEHRTLIHYNRGHNFADYDTVPIPVMTDPQAWAEEGDRSYERVNSFPPAYLDSFTRNPLPERVLFDLGTRAPERSVTSFYYLRAPFGTAGLIDASYDRKTNTVSLITENLEGDFSILLNEEMVDFTQPVTVIVNGTPVSVEVTPDLRVLEETTAERGDPNFQFEAELFFSELEKLAEK